MKRICFIFCVCVEIVFRVVSSIRRVGFIVIVVVCENYLDFVDVKIYGFFKIDW